MIKKILVPLDGSKLAEQILPQVEEMAKGLQAEVILITIGSLLWAVPASESGLRSAEEFAAQKKIEAEKKLAEVGEALKVRGLKVSYVYRESFASAAQEIIFYAENNGCDLIAMATHGKGEVAWVLGSVAEKVVSHATVPVHLLRVIEKKSPIRKREDFVGRGEVTLGS
jgi:nucleotide-binding universal stress UspA family protein